MLIPVSIAISVVVFMIVHLLPGDPIDNLLRVGSSPEDRADLAHGRSTASTRPLVVQYVLLDRLDGCRATSARRSCCAARSADLIAQNLPYSLVLGGAGLRSSPPSSA